MARVDPYKNFNFLVDIGGITQAGFSEVTGLSLEVEVIDYREGADKSGVARKLPGRRKVGDITLKRGVTKSDELQSWIKNVMNGVTDRRNGSIVLLDDDRTEVVRWHFIEAFPTKWEGPDLNATGNEVAIESLTLACEGLERST